MDKLNAIFAGAPSAEGVTALTVETTLITMAAALLIGLIVSITYMKTYDSGAYAQSFVLTLIMIPLIIAIIILVVGSNVARAFSLAGAFSLIRFRNSLGDTKDITYIFFTMATGLACGAGLYWYALMFAVLLCIIMIVLHISKFGKTRAVSRTLKITIPENMNFNGAFDEVFEKYGVRASLNRAKTVDLGSLYELIFDVVIDSSLDEKKFIDDLRCRNGNLSIVLTVKPVGEAW